MKKILCLKTNRRSRVGLYFNIPIFILLALLVVYPFMTGIYISFFRTNLVTIWKFVGFGNYIKNLYKLGVWRAWMVTFIYTTVVVSSHFIIGMILALLLNVKGKRWVIFRALFLVPWLIPTVVAAMTWKWMYNGMYGIINYMLMGIGIIKTPISWLGNANTALPAVIIVAIWKGFPFVMIMLLAGLQTVSEELHEAAQIDGASLWQRFINVTIPQLYPVISITGLLDILVWFKAFVAIYLLTGGGPIDATTTIVLKVYLKAFGDFYFGEAAALSVYVFLVSGSLAALYYVVLKKMALKT